MRRVHHIDGNARNNAPENLRMVGDHDNGRPRSHQDEIDRAVAEHKAGPGFSPGPWEVHGDPGKNGCYVHAANRVCDIVQPQGFKPSYEATGMGDDVEVWRRQ